MEKYLYQSYLPNLLLQVEIECKGQPVGPTLTLHSLADIWLQHRPSQRTQAVLGASAQEFVMVLHFHCKAPIHWISPPVSRWSWVRKPFLWLPQPRWWLKNSLPLNIITTNTSRELLCFLRTAFVFILGSNVDEIIVLSLRVFWKQHCYIYSYLFEGTIFQPLCFTSWFCLLRWNLCISWCWKYDNHAWFLDLRMQLKFFLLPPAHCIH